MSGERFRRLFMREREREIKRERENSLLNDVTTRPKVFQFALAFIRTLKMEFIDTYWGTLGHHMHVVDRE